MSCGVYSASVGIGTNITPSVVITSQSNEMRSGSAYNLLTSASSNTVAPVISLGSIVNTQYLSANATDQLALRSKFVYLANEQSFGSGGIQLGNHGFSVVNMVGLRHIRTFTTSITETAQSFASTVSQAYSIVCGLFSVNSGSGNITLKTTGTITLDAPNVIGAVPSGTIVMYGLSTVPTGWVVCDGTNGAPDLRGRFVIGANPMGSGTNPTLFTTALGTNGGSQNVVGAHTHRYWDTKFSESGNSLPWYLKNYDTEWSGATLPINLAAIGSSSTDNNNVFMGNAEYTESPTGSTNDTRPPYHALVYIMKL